jgi:3-deoxy-D-manno-octulosonic acid kinase
MDKPGFHKIEGGRGGSVKISLDGIEVILRPYYRGGMVKRLVADQYLWTGKTRTRPWQEWMIMQRARAAGLAVPEPIAACALKSGLCYRAAIMTRFVDDTETLASRLAEAVLETDRWYQLGLLIKRMQLEGIRHADLNASNILVDKQDQFYIIDFDKARVVTHLDDWQWQPLYRLQRSLEKFDRNDPLNYHPNDWQALMDGYQS